MARRGRARTGDDFLVAGRSLPAHVLVFTLLSTWIGSGSLFAGAGLGYRVGFPALWQSAGAWVGIALIFFLAPRVRRLAQYTVPDILELRYGRTGAACSARSPSSSPTPRSPPISSAAAAGCCNLVAGVDPRHRRVHHRGVLRRLHRARRHALGRAVSTSSTA